VTALRTASEVSHGDHVCAFFDSPGERRRIVADFVRTGLQAGDRVFYVTDAASPATVLAELRADGVPVAAALAGGQLAVRTVAESYLAVLPFDPARMISAVYRAVEDALSAGFTGLRVSGDMTWASRDVPGSDRLLEYESRVGQLFCSRPAAAMCQYDRRRFDRTTLSAAPGLHTHRLRSASDSPPYS
jgi:hypothetical protein